MVASTTSARADNHHQVEWIYSFIKHPNVITPDFLLQVWGSHEIKWQRTTHVHVFRCPSELQFRNSPKSLEAEPPVLPSSGAIQLPVAGSTSQKQSTSCRNAPDADQLRDVRRISASDCGGHESRCADHSFKLFGRDALAHWVCSIRRTDEDREGDQVCCARRGHASQQGEFLSQFSSEDYHFVNPVLHHSNPPNNICLFELLEGR